MFAAKSKLNVVIHALLIVVVLFNALASSIIFAQAKQGSISTTSKEQELEQEDHSIPLVERSSGLLDK